MYSDLDIISELKTDRRIEFDLSDRGPGPVTASIQPHGLLLALAPDDLRILHVGGDAEGVLGMAAESLLASTAARVLPAAQLEQLRVLSGTGLPLERPRFVFPRTTPGGETADVLAHRASGLLMIEFEPRREPWPDDPLALVDAMLRPVRQAPSSQALCDSLAAELLRVTGFDRVTVFRFHPDGSGEMVTEVLSAAEPGPIGLRRPKAELPQRKPGAGCSELWSVADARDEPAPILSVADPSKSPLDLSRAVLRSATPKGRRHLRRSGVVAALSLPIVHRGELWGSIACHHPSPRHLPYHLREACRLFAEAASAQLEARLMSEQVAARLQSTRIHDELVTRMSQESDLADGLIRFHPNLLDFIAATGVGLWIDGQFTAIGSTPDAAQITPLAKWLGGVVRSGIYHTDCLPLVYPPSRAFAAQASGLLALSLSEAPRDYVLWFRREYVRTTADHDRTGELIGTGTDWQQPLRRQAEPWLPTEIEAAHRLRLSLLEVVLRRIDGIARERRSARLLQEQLMRQVETGLRRSKDVARTLQEETRRRVSVEADLSQVLRRTVEDQEAERLRIARELHDTLGQSLTLLQLGFDRLGQIAPDNAEAQQRVATMKALATDIGRQVNRLAWEIRPTALDDLGLQTAIQHLLDAWSETSNVAFDLHMTLGDRRLPPAVETTLYRVLQEALTNVVRHAAAHQVSVVVGLSDHQVAMVVEDDGRGFANGNADRPSNRLGLLGMRERLSLVGGTLEIESAPGKGTALYARIPL